MSGQHARAPAGFCADLALYGEQNIHALDQDLPIVQPSQVEEFAPRICSTRRRDRSRLARNRQVSGVPVAPGVKMSPRLIVIAPTTLVPASMAALLTVTGELTDRAAHHQRAGAYRHAGAAIAVVGGEHGGAGPPRMGRVERKSGR
jgi:hypothetical protein